jgi:hypothetical protein
MSIPKTSFLFFFILLLFSSCKKNQQYVPNVYVNLIVYVNDPQNLAIGTTGGWKYFDGGYHGLLVYRKGPNEFMVYDRTCPYQPEESDSFVSVDTTNNIILKDNSCGSQFLLNDGTPISGDAVVPLKTYRYVFDGTVLRVNN